MRESELFCKKLYEALNFDGYYLSEVKNQSHGEHDFNIFCSDGSCVGILEVTSAIHETSKISLARTLNHGPIKSKALSHGWLLMVHNPDPRWVQTEGVENLIKLEKYGINEFTPEFQYHQNEEVSISVKALNDNNIENGGQCGESGTIYFLTSHGENNDPYVHSVQSVIEAALSALRKSDNTFKLSREKNPSLRNRILFVEIDPLTYTNLADSMHKLPPPKTPPTLDGKATEIWVATHIFGEIVVWRGDNDGWSKWHLSAHEFEN